MNGLAHLEPRFRPQYMCEVEEVQTSIFIPVTLITEGSHAEVLEEADRMDTSAGVGSSDVDRRGGLLAEASEKSEMSDVSAASFSLFALASRSNCSFASLVVKIRRS